MSLSTCVNIVPPLIHIFFFERIFIIFGITKSIYSNDDSRYAGQINPLSAPSIIVSLNYEFSLIYSIYLTFSEFSCKQIV